MIETDIDANVNYKAAYEGAMMQIEALHKIIEENKRRWYKYDTINIFLISILLIISIIVKCVSPVRTAKANSKLKQSSEIQGFQSFFFFSLRQKWGPEISGA